MHEFNPAYVGPRDDVVSLVPDTARRVLDVGCSVGTLGAQLKANRSVEVYGVECDREMARQAARKLDKVICGDIQHVDIECLVGPDGVDCLVLADILEHLADPWDTLNRLVQFLHADGRVIISVPNVRHFTAIANLLFRGDWPCRDRGLFDRTHMRWFTLKSVRELCSGAGLQIELVRRNYRIVDSPHRINRVATLLALPGIRELLTYQYLIVAKK